MKASTTKSKGFMLIETIIIFFVIASLVFGGWLVWNKTHKKDNGTSAGSQADQNQNSVNKKQSVDLSEGGKYLVIKEWNVRIPLPESLQRDVEYGIYYLNNGDQTAYFASKKLAAKATVKDCELVPVNDSNGHGMFGGLVAVTRSSADDQKDVVADLKFQKDNYWYTLGFSNGGACYEGDTGNDEAPFKSVMAPAVKKLESIKY